VVGAGLLAEVGDWAAGLEEVVAVLPPEQPASRATTISIHTDNKSNGYFTFINILLFAFYF
jgi:hypothetical protein